VADGRIGRILHASPPLNGGLDCQQKGGRKEKYPFFTPTIRNMSQPIPRTALTERDPDCGRKMIVCMLYWWGKGERELFQYLFHGRLLFPIQGERGILLSYIIGLMLYCMVFEELWNGW
jgi:hypothetical protein